MSANAALGLTSVTKRIAAGAIVKAQLADWGLGRIGVTERLAGNDRWPKFMRAAAHP